MKKTISVLSVSMLAALLVPAPPAQALYPTNVKQECWEHHFIGENPRICLKVGYKRQEDGSGMSTVKEEIYVYNTGGLEDPDLKDVTITVTAINSSGYAKYNQVVEGTWRDDAIVKAPGYTMTYKVTYTPNPKPFQGFSDRVTRTMSYSIIP